MGYPQLDWGSISMDYFVYIIANKTKLYTGVAIVLNKRTYFGAVLFISQHLLMLLDPTAPAA